MRKKKVSCGKKTAVMALAVFLGTMLMTDVLPVYPENRYLAKNR